MKTVATMRHENRGGFALPVAVFALVVVGVLVTGGFYMARQETRIGQASQSAQSAFYFAEQGIYNTLANWNAPTYSRMAAWGTTTVTGTVTDGSYSVDLMRMTNRLYFLRSTGTVTSGGALWSGGTRQVGMVVRIMTPEMDPPAALTALGDLTVGGTSLVDGTDTNPPQWTGLCDATENGPGILMDDTTNLAYVGAATDVNGYPAIAQDTAMTVDNLLTFGDDYTWDYLVALASKQYNHMTTITNTAPDSVLSGGSYICRTTTTSNWGQPLNPQGACGNYFPIIYGRGNLNINSSASGQGILLVEGDLSVQGGYNFYGPVFVKGRLRTAGTGGHFNGGVIAANADLSTSTVLGDAVVTYSGCAVERALVHNSDLARPRPLARRSWVDVSNINY